MTVKSDIILIAELMVKVGAMERLLIKNNIIKADDLVLEIKKISEEITEVIARQSIVETNKQGN